MGMECNSVKVLLSSSWTRTIGASSRTPIEIREKCFEYVVLCKPDISNVRHRWFINRLRS